MGASYNAAAAVLPGISGSTGVRSGGQLSVGTPNTTFSVSDGVGVITDPVTGVAKEVSWTGLTNITATHIAAANVSYVAIDSAGLSVQQILPFTNTQSRDLIVLGSLIHTNNLNLGTTNAFAYSILATANRLADFAGSVGKFNIFGNIYTANGANLSINKSIGTAYELGSNWNTSVKNPDVIALGALIAPVFDYVNQDGVNSGTTTVVDPDTYDLAGVDTVVPNNKFTVQLIYVFTSNFTTMQLGQKLYSTLAAAKEDIASSGFITAPTVAQNGLLRGFLVVKKGVTDLTSADAEFLEANRFGGGATSITGVTTLQGAYNNSLAPQMVTSAALGPVTIKDGTGVATNKLIDLENFTSDKVFSVDGDGKMIIGGAVSLDRSALLSLGAVAQQNGVIRLKAAGTGDTRVELLGTSGRANLDSLALAGTLSAAGLETTAAGVVQAATIKESFFAYLSVAVGNVTGNGAIYTVICPITSSNVGSAYNASTGVFTALVTDIFDFSAVIDMYTLPVGVIVSCQFSIGTSLYYFTYRNILGSSGQLMYSGNISSIPMTAGDSASVRIFVTGMAGNTLTLGGSSGGAVKTTIFSGRRAS